MIHPSNGSAPTPRGRLGAALAGRPTDRTPCAPLAVHYTAALTGTSMEDYTLNPETMVDCICRYYERFHPDAVWLSADTWISAEAMGARVAFPGDNQPLAGAGEAAIRSAADIDRIPPADPSTQGRMPLMLEAMSRLRRRLGDDVAVVGCFDQSPFSLACALGGINDIMIQVITEPERVRALLERCIEYAAAYANALGAAGADLLSTGDSPAGLMGPDLYQNVALPAERRVFAAIAEGCGVPTSLHVCGDATPLLPHMATAGAAVLEIDYRVDLDTACRTVPDPIALWGNLDPVGVLQDGTPQQVAVAAREALDTIRRHGRSRFVLSSGCTLTPGTPATNLDALIASVL